MKGRDLKVAKIRAVVVRADGSIEDYGVIAGPQLQVWVSKLKRSVNKLWQRLLKLLQLDGK